MQLCCTGWHAACCHSNPSCPANLLIYLVASSLLATVPLLCAEQRAAAEARAAAASAKIERLEELVHTLQKEVSSKGSSMAWLEDQVHQGMTGGTVVKGRAWGQLRRNWGGRWRWVVADWLLWGTTRHRTDSHSAFPALQLAAAKKEAASRQEAGAAALAAAQERHAADRAALEQAAAAAQAAADHAAQEVAALRQRRMHEMEELEGRFTTLLATKDRTIASLTQQLQELHAVLS